MALRRLGPYLIPMIVITYSGYMISEQFIGDSRESSQNYALFMGGIAILCALFVIVRTAFVSDIELSNDDFEIHPRAHYIQLGAVIVAATATTLMLNTLGYVICLFALIITSLWILGVRSKRRILAIAVITVLVVHFVLVKELELPLPGGVLSDVL